MNVFALCPVLLFLIKINSTFYYCDRIDIEMFPNFSLCLVHSRNLQGGIIPTNSFSLFYVTNISCVLIWFSNSNSCGLKKLCWGNYFQIFECNLGKGMNFIVI